MFIFLKNNFIFCSNANIIKPDDKDLFINNWKNKFKEYPNILQILEELWELQKKDASIQVETIENFLEDQLKESSKNRSVSDATESLNKRISEQLMKGMKFYDTTSSQFQASSKSQAAPLTPQAIKQYFDNICKGFSVKILLDFILTPSLFNHNISTILELIFTKGGMPKITLLVEKYFNIDNFHPKLIEHLFHYMTTLIKNSDIQEQEVFANFMKHLESLNTMDSFTLTNNKEVILRSSLLFAKKMAYHFVLQRIQQAQNNMGKFNVTINLNEEEKNQNLGMNFEITEATKTMLIKYYQEKISKTKWPTEVINFSLSNPQYRQLFIFCPNNKMSKFINALESEKTENNDEDNLIVLKQGSKQIKISLSSLNKIIQKENAENHKKEETTDNKENHKKEETTDNKDKEENIENIENKENKDIKILHLWGEKPRKDIPSLLSMYIQNYIIRSSLNKEENKSIIISDYDKIKKLQKTIEDFLSLYDQCSDDKSKSIFFSCLQYQSYPDFTREFNKRKPNQKIWWIKFMIVIIMIIIFQIIIYKYNPEIIKLIQYFQNIIRRIFPENKKIQKQIKELKNTKKPVTVKKKPVTVKKKPVTSRKKIKNPLSTGKNKTPVINR